MNNSFPSGTEYKDKLLKDFDSLESKEQDAFLAWFAGGHIRVTKYENRSHVNFGKAECQWVDFEDFWLGKLPRMGIIKPIVMREFVAKGALGCPKATEYQLTCTKYGFDVYEAYWKRWKERADAIDIDYLNMGGGDDTKKD